MGLRRTGLTTLRQLAYRMCRLIAKFDPIIRKVYPDATELHLALEAANTACALLVSESDDVLPAGI